MGRLILKVRPSTQIPPRRASQTVFALHGIQIDWALLQNAYMCFNFKAAGKTDERPASEVHTCSFMAPFSIHFSLYKREWH